MGGNVARSAPARVRRIVLGQFAFDAIAVNRHLPLE